MAINFPKKDDKIKAHLVDLLRILCWQQYKLENQKPEGVNGLDFYQIFAEEWHNHEIHNYTVAKIEKLIKDLGYSIDELEENAKTYYEAKKAYQTNFQLKVEQKEEEPLF